MDTSNPETHPPHQNLLPLDSAHVLWCVVLAALIVGVGLLLIRARRHSGAGGILLIARARLWTLTELREALRAEGLSVLRPPALARSLRRLGLRSTVQALHDRPEWWWDALTTWRPASHGA